MSEPREGTNGNAESSALVAGDITTAASTPSSSTIPPGPPPGPPPAGNGFPGRIPPGPPPGAPPGQMYRPMPPRPAQYGYPAPGMFPPGPPVGYPPVMPNFPPPLPPGWSEHRAPDGITPYYYNSQSRQSTYTRPTLSFPPFAPPNMPPSTSTPSEPKKKAKKEKPKEKVPIPGTSWTRVTTTEGNVFYFEKESKKSEWTVPDEIKREVEALEAEEKAQKEKEEREEEERKVAERLEQLKEAERIRLDIEEERKAKIEKMKALEGKRKEREDNGEDGRESKVPKVEGGEGEGENDDDGVIGPVDEEDEEAWMKAVAAEFSAADSDLKQEQEKNEEAQRLSEVEAAKKVFAVPTQVNVTLEEQRALFKALLIEKDISPFADWDTSLPLFINDPRYILLSSVKDRRDVFEEYCRDVGRARRLKKQGIAGGGSAAVAESKKQDPERDYKALLREDVTSTRTRFEDFRKKWKKDRRFYGFGRDDREREKVFKVHLKELGERKRADAERAQTDFMDLLKETSDISSSSQWSDIKRRISSDSRYDPVGSSSLREELFNTHIRKLASTSSNGAGSETLEEAAERKLRERKEREAASLKEREARVRSEQMKVSMENNKSRAGAGREEAERLFGSLLVDMVRDHDATWNEAVKYLESDPRFNHPSLNPMDKQRLFSLHLNKLNAKRSSALHQLFLANSPDLDTPYEEVYPKIVDDFTVKRLGLEGEALEERFKAWKRSREVEARREFDVMLGENSFVDFWGRMRKKTLDEAALAVKEDEMDEGEGAGGGGAADLTGMAKQIDLKEITAVLRRDKRYRIFDHIPEVREQWLRDYLDNLEAAQGNQTIHNVAHQR